MALREVTLATLSALLLWGCTHTRMARGDEPRDPTEADEPALAANQEDVDALPGLLARTVLHFGFDDASLTQTDRDNLERLAHALRMQPWATVRIAGHADERGTEEYNLALGQKRADAARRFLLALGVDPTAVEAITFGEEVPANLSADEEAWAENRRAEFDAKPAEMVSTATEVTP